MVHVAYKGAGPAVNALLAGEVQIMFAPIVAVLPHVKAGRLKAIALTSAKPSPSVPGVPTVAQGGLPGYEITGWHGIAVRAGTPAPVVEKLNLTINEIFKDPAFRTKWEAIGTPVVAGTPQAFGALIAADSKKLGKLVKDAGIVME
jgi:tripartite-type tricarboxylate transporter receptor subunit TctC